MGRNFKIVILMLFFTFMSCTTYKNQFYVGSQDLENARINVIFDFTNTYKTPNRYLKRRHYKPFDVFLVRGKILDDKTYFISVLPNVEPIAISIEDELGKIPRSYFPNRYIEKEDKLFLWNDSSSPLQSDVLDAMNKFGVLDSTDVKMELGLLPNDFEDTRMITIDDRLVSYKYFVCRSDVSKFKRIVTYKASVNYKIPKIKCR